MEGINSKIITGTDTSKKKILFVLSLLSVLPNSGCRCGNYSRCTTTQLIGQSSSTVGKHKAGLLSSNEKPSLLPLLFCVCIDNSRGEKGEKKKSMLSNAEIGKCHFDKCKPLCTHRLNFDGFLPGRAYFFIYRSSYKNVKQ